MKRRDSEDRVNSEQNPDSVERILYPAAVPGFRRVDPANMLQECCKKGGARELRERGRISAVPGIMSESPSLEKLGV